MADIEIGPLTDRLSDPEIAELARQMTKLGVGEIPRGDLSAQGTVGDGLDDDIMDELLDRLDMNDAAAEIYVPVEFDGVIEVGHFRVASLATLLDALEEIRDELGVEDEEDEEEEDEEEDEDEDRPDSEAALRGMLRVLQDGATIALDRRVPLHIKS